MSQQGNRRRRRTAAADGARIGRTMRAAGGGGRTVDGAKLSAAVAALAVVATQDFVVDDLLAQLCQLAAEALDVDGAGVMSYEHGRTRFIRASVPRLNALEQMQQDLQAGPCWDAVQSCTAVTAGTQREMEPRWPAFATAASRAGVSSLVVVPLVSRGRSWGSLDLYRLDPGGWDQDQLNAAKLLADVAASYLVMAADRDDARSAHLELAGQALHDQLTGLPNRVLMFELISQALASADRNQTPVAVLFIDLDRFKAVNDTYGHKTGDTVLTTVSQRMSSVLRANDTLGRLAGDEFLVLLDTTADPAGTTPQETLRTVAERLRQAIKVPIVVGDERIRMTGSIGAAVTTDGLSATDLIHDADTAMYQAKAAGRDRVVLQVRTGRVPLTHRRYLERGLLHAIDRGELEVYYQPILTADRTLAAVEALARWNHPEHGLLAARDFIDLAHDNGTIVDIGKWVVEQACTQLRTWRDTTDNPPPLLFCNLSPLELASADLPAELHRVLERNGLLPADLGLEILEADFAHGQLIELLGGFRAQGHPLAIDDFGTGYSSLARLVELPLSYVKIDHSFVSKLPDDTRSQGLVAAIVTIARQLDIAIIAEGIETAEQSRFLVEAGCELLQGFYFGPPMPAPSITDLLHEDRWPAASSA